MLSMDLGTKLVVVGVSASGKSTLARALAEKLRIPLTHMDTIWWKPGWVEVGEEEAAKQLERITSGEAWIIEGYIPKISRPLVFERADHILYLDYHRSVAARRYIKRWWKHRKDPRPELQGSPEKWDFKFLKLVWNKGEAISLNKFLKLVENQQKIVTLQSPNQTKVFLRDV